MSKRPSSDIDPRVLRTPPKRRKRRARNKPDPDRELIETADAARSRADARPYPPGVMLEDDGESWLPTSDHNDADRWTLQLADAFGTRSTAVIQFFFDQLRDLCAEDWDDVARSWKTNETELNAVIALVADVEPQNTKEAALAAQMVSVHLLQMKMTKDALNCGGHVLERTASLASKLARTYSMQLDALRKLRNGGRPETVRQEIHVTKEQHVHYHDHRGGPENGSQSERTNAGELNGHAGTLEERRSLPSNRQIDGRAVQVGSGEGKEGVPLPRGAGRRTKGQR